jgi:hypothetical protein
MSLLTLSSSKIPLNKAKEANSDEKNDSLFDSKTSCLIIAGGTLSSFLGYIFVAGVQIYVCTPLVFLCISCIGTKAICILEVQEWKFKICALSTIWFHSCTPLR